MIMFAIGKSGEFVRLLLPLIKTLDERGEATTVVLKCLSDAGLLPNSCNLLPLPSCRTRAVQPTRRARTYVDILWDMGLHDKQAVATEVSCWQNILTLVKPRVVIGNHTPTLALACAVSGIKMICVGSGYATPPVGKPLVVLEPDCKEPEPNEHTAVLAALSPWLTRAGLPEDVTQIYGRTQTLACCLPELDPYRETRTELAASPMGMLPAPIKMEARPTRMLACLDGAARVSSQILHELIKSRARCDVLLGNPRTPWADAVKETNMGLLSNSVNLVEALENCALVLHHGELATVETALAMGIPQFLVPFYPEQKFYARKVTELSCGEHLQNLKAVFLELAKGEKREPALKAAQALAKPTRSAQDELLKLVDAEV